MKYYWTRPSDISGSFAVRGGRITILEKEFSVEFYEPDPALYRNFADLPLANDQAYADFANEHGLLSLGGLNVKFREGEPVRFWKEQVFKLKAVVELNDLMGNPRRLQRIAQPRLQDGVFRVAVPFDPEKHWEIGLNPDQSASIKTNADRVRFVVSSEVVKAFGKNPILIKPRWDDIENRFLIEPNPSNLISLIWYQAAMAMAGEGPVLHKCENPRCGRWVERRRSTKRSCGAERCKKAIQRQNKLRQ